MPAASAVSFIRRFLMHVLPKGFHRIRHYGLLANGSRADNVAKPRALLNVPKPDAIPDDPKSADAAEPPALVVKVNERLETSAPEVWAANARTRSPAARCATARASIRRRSPTT